MKRVPDGVYAQQYLRECRDYVRLHTDTLRIAGIEPGQEMLDKGEWATTKVTIAANWREYTAQHGPLKAVQPDGSTREWDYRELFR